jgi:hypothetical protein
MPVENDFANFIKLHADFMWGLYEEIPEIIDFISRGVDKKHCWKDIMKNCSRGLFTQLL